MTVKIEEMIGKRFGKLVIKQLIVPGYANKRKYLCECDCGGKKIVDDFYNHAKVVGICLFPWEEGFNTAEDACNWFKKKEEEELTHKIAQAENRLDAAKETGELL